MEVEAFLCTVCVQKRGVQVKQHVLRFPDGIDDLPHLLLNRIQLSERVCIHAIPETGQGRLRSQFVFIMDRGQYRIIRQFICGVIFKVSGYDLVNYLHQVIRILMDAAFRVGHWS